MRKASVLLLLVVALVGGAAPTSSADDPTPVVIVDPPPFPAGADVMIRPADRSQGFAGAGARGPGQAVAEHVTQFQRAAAIVKVCNVGASRALRVRGTDGGVNWRVRYVVRSHDVTRAVTHGTYWTRRLADGGCVRLRMTARLELGASDLDQAFRVGAVPRVGARDAVTLSVHVDGPLVLP